mmetsp:Transcript_234/g.713  ORF Transcript_234/g.713 Transcript_234/m.713 type:complete len:205 (+) Transcript_234:1363-1977(+)
MGPGQHCRCPDEAKVPADAQQEESGVEIRKIDALQGHDPGHRQNGQPQPHDLFCAEPRDQMAGKKRRGEHGEHVHSDHIGRVRLTKSAADNGQRRGRHNEVHQRIGDCGAYHSDRDARRCQQLAPAAPGAVGGRGGGRLGNVQKEEQCHAHDIEPHRHVVDRDIACHCRVGAGGGDIARDLRANDGRQKAARHDVGNGLGPKRL